MGYWNIKANQEKKVLNIELVGDLKPEEAHIFIEDFFKAQEKINPKECKLVFDLGRWFIYPRDVEMMLKDFFIMYKEKGYSVVVMKIFLPQKELRRKMEILAEKVGLETLEFYIVH